MLTLTPRLARKAFVIVDPALAGKLGSVNGFRQEDETPFESMIRERKVALNRLFDKTNLQPVHESGPSGTKSKRELVEKYDADELRKKKRANSVVTAVVEEGDGVGMDGDGEVIDENALNLVYSRGNDANLPEMQPPPSFKLNLRGYQQQALHWMHRMEGGGSNEERDSSMHPLWEQYVTTASLKHAANHTQDICSLSRLSSPTSTRLSRRFSTTIRIPASSRSSSPRQPPSAVVGSWPTRWDSERSVLASLEQELTDAPRRSW